MSLRHTPWEEASDFSIGLKPIAEAGWLEGGEPDPAARKDPLFACARDTVFGELAGSRPGQIEIAEIIAAASGSCAGAADLPPLQAAARQVSDDLVLMEKRDGAWTVAALSLCAPTFFTAHHALGRTLEQLHQPVDGFQRRLLARVERIFESLRPGTILERRNWTLVNSPEPFTPDPEPIRARIGEIAPRDAGHALFLRVERQALRRLPHTGGAVFTIRVWLDPLHSLAAQPERLAAFATAWRRAAPGFRAYKRLDLYAPLVEDFLRATGESRSIRVPRSAS